VALPLCSQAVLSGEDSPLDQGTVWWLSVMGRLKPGWTLQRASAELGSLSPGIFEATLPKNYPRENVKDYLRFKLAAYPASTGVSYLRDQYADPLWLLLGTAGLVLLIACANLASLLLARATTREKEIGVRLALGASRSRLIRQLMAESLLLAAAGAALGLLMARTLSQFLVAFLSTQGNKLFLDLRPDARVLGFTAGVAILTCLFFGLAPALRATRVAPGSMMKTGGRGLTTSRERFGLRRALVCAQVALSVVLLVGAILFSRSLHNVVTADTGFQQRGVLITWVDMTRLRLPVARRIPFKRELLDRLRAIPGVQAASDARILPLSGSGTDNRVWRAGSDREHGIDANFNSVSREYFRTLQMPLLAGRDFSDADGPAMQPVAIVDQAFVRQLGLGANAVGQTFYRESTPSDPQMGFEIVGLVGDTKYRDIHRGFVPIVYLSTSQDPRPDVSDQILIRSRVPMAALVPAVRQAIATIDPGITSDFESFGDVIKYDTTRERLMATISGFFGALAGLLAVIGLYGVISYMVVQRTSEIGIRMTLGAGGSEVLIMILREAGMLLLVGLGAGLLLTLAGGSAARTLLFGLQPYDPLTLAAAALLLAVVALAASYLPARRAAKLDPMEALRYE
jgi:predicted permease